MIASALLAVAALSQPTLDESEFTPLFDGESLNGWRQEGGKAEYSVEDGQIVGRAVPGTPNSFLCSVKQYDDFILRLEFKVDSRLNSGVQIRSNVFDEKKTYREPRGGDEGREINVMAGRVLGYQVEIDPSARAWTGGIYDEGRRGWLANLKENESARKAFKPDAWNEFVVVAKGDSIKTYLNGVPAADLNDDMTPTGFIALQVHSIGKKELAGAEVRWRNIRIKELEGE